MGTLRSRGEEKKSLLKPHLCQCQLIFELSLYRNEMKSDYQPSSINHHPSTAAPLHSARPKIKLFYSVKWCESSENALFIEKSWIIMLRIKIPCWLGTVQDLPSTWLVQEAWLCSRCAAELWIVNCELNVMHAANLSHACTRLGTYMYRPRFMHAIFGGRSLNVHR